MLGLGIDRLRARPSLLDLIGSRSADNTNDSASVGSSASSPPGTANLPPLPDSPATTSTTTSNWSTSNNQDYTTHETPSNNRTLSLKHQTSSFSVPPSRITMASGNAGEEHGSVFSVSGSVVVAENMIGCAMYELVCC